MSTQADNLDKAKIDRGVSGSKFSEALEAHQLTQPGYYWWLPACDRHNSKNPEYWNVLAWHPKDPARRKSGIFVGPLMPPTESH